MKKEFKQWFDAINECAAKPVPDENLPKGAIFGFIFPSKISLKDSFKKGDVLAISRAYFFENNTAKIFSKESQREITWLSAYDHIAKSSLGAKTIPLPVEAKGILPSEGVIVSTIDAWITAFNRIPFVQAEKGIRQNGEYFMVRVFSSIADALSEDLDLQFRNTIRCFLNEETGKDCVEWNDSETEDDGLWKLYAGNAENKGWEESLRCVQEYVSSLIKRIPAVELSTLPNIQFSEEDVKSRLEKFISSTKDRFGVLPGTSVNEEIYSGRVLGISFPLTIGGLLRNSDTHGFIGFRGDGWATFDVYEDSKENESFTTSDAFRTYLEQIAEAPYGTITWEKAIECSVNFLNELAKVVSVQTVT